MQKLISTIILLVIISTMTIVEASAAYITFDEYSLTTVITDQYEDQGVIFSGTLSPPQIADPTWAFPTQDVDISLGGGATDYNWGTGNIVFAFYDPKTGGPIEAENISYWPIALARLSSDVLVTYYDVNGNVIDEFYWYSQATTEWIPFRIPFKFHKCVLEPQTAYLWIDDLKFLLPCTGTDGDGDGHYTPDSCMTPHDDCNDSDPAIPGLEVCDDGKDNDCDGSTDCFDLDCSPNPVCFPPDCSGNVEE